MISKMPAVQGKRHAECLLTSEGATNWKSQASEILCYDGYDGALFELLSFRPGRREDFRDLVVGHARQTSAPAPLPWPELSMRHTFRGKRQNGVKTVSVNEIVSCVSSVSPHF
jgi:hypothetical protein